MVAISQILELYKKNFKIGLNFLKLSKNKKKKKKKKKKKTTTTTTTTTKMLICGCLHWWGGDGVRF